MPDVISFAGGFPILRRFPASASPRSWRSSPPPARRARSSMRRRGARRSLDAVAGRVETLQGRRPSEEEPAHERRDRGARAGRQVLPRPRRRGRQRGADLPRRDPGVPELRGRPRRRPHGRRRARSRRARAAARRRSAARSTRSPTTRTLPGSACARAARALVELARRRLRARRGRGLSRARPISTRRSLWSLGPDVVLQTGTTSKMFFPRAPRLGGRAGRRRRAACRRQAEHGSVCRRARPAPVRGVAQARVDRRAAGPVADALPRQVRAAARRARALLPDGASWTRPQAASSPG